MNISTDSPNSSSLAVGEPQKIVMDLQVPVEHVVNKSDSSDASTTSNSNTTSPSSTTSISYWRLLIDYPMYRYFLISYIVTQLGEWLTYVASLSILELASTSVNTIDDVIVESAATISPAESLSSIPGGYPEQQEKNHFLISILVVCRLIPTTLSSFFGGMLADTCDRKLIMFRLDVCGGCVAMVYCIMSIQALHTDSSDENQSSTIVSTTTVIVLLLCTIAQSTISGLYLPSRSSIVPMLVGEDKSDNIEKANEMSSIVWSLMAAVGSSFGGFIVDHYGVAICFATDTIMYFTSALILVIFVTGNYNVMLTSAEKSTKATTNSSHTSNIPSINGDTINFEIDVNSKKLTTTDPSELKTSITKQIIQSDNGSKNHGGIRGLLHEVRLFVTTHNSAPYLLIKGCGAILFGASDVIQVTFAQDPETGVLDPQRLGYLFSAVGVGCLLGPILMPPGRCYLSACIASYYVIALGYGCMAWSQNFWWKCFWTVVRASGTAVLWVDSTILLQTTIPATLLGRISSIDFAIALLGEAASAMFAGLGQDYGLSAQQVSFTLSGVGMFWGVLWTVATIYHRHQHHKKSSKRDLSSVELEPLTLNP